MGVLHMVSPLVVVLSVVVFVHGLVAGSQAEEDWGPLEALFTRLKYACASSLLFCLGVILAC